MQETHCAFFSFKISLARCKVDSTADFVGGTVVVTGNKDVLFCSLCKQAKIQFKQVPKGNRLATKRE